MIAAACSGGGDEGESRRQLLQPGERMPGGMTISSPAFRAGQAIPERFSCEGENVPPPLRWSPAPPAARELALVVEDPDAPGQIFVHWIVVGIDPRTTSITPDGPIPGAVVLEGSSDNATYIGPCPPDGDGAHRYHFEIYALGKPPRLVDGARPIEVVRAIREAAVAGGQVVGTFAR